MVGADVEGCLWAGKRMREGGVEETEGLNEL